MTHQEKGDGEPAASVFDQKALVVRAGGDRELLQEIVGLFFVEAPKTLSAIRESIARGDSETLERAAHSLKGTVSNFGARSACEAALRLEMAGHGGNLTHAELAYAELEKEIGRLGQALALFREEQ
jgi:HPt (histidine-containing phosphotransfer) domain-containing protein